MTTRGTPRTSVPSKMLYSTAWKTRSNNITEQEPSADLQTFPTCSILEASESYEARNHCTNNPNPFHTEACCSSGNGSDVICRKSLLILSDSYLNNLSKACCQNPDQFRNTVQRKQGTLEMRGREWGRKYIKVYRVCVCWQKCDHPSKCYWRFAKSNAVHPTRPKHSMTTHLHHSSE